MGLEGQLPPPPPGATATLARPEDHVSAQPQPTVQQPSSSENPDTAASAASAPAAFLDMEEPGVKDLPRTVESAQDGRSERVERLAMAVLNREIHRTENTIGEIGATDPDAARAAYADPGTSALLTLGRIQDLREGENLSFDDEPLRFPDGITVTSMIRNGDGFMCAVEGVDTPVPISQQDVVDAQLVSEAESILKKIAGENEAYVVKKYIDVIHSGEIALPTKGSEGAKALDNAMNTVEEKFAKEGPQTPEGRFIADQLAQVEQDIAEIETTRIAVEGSREEVKASKAKMGELQAKIAAGTATPEEMTELSRLSEAEAKLARLDKLSEYKRLQEVLAEVAKADGKGNAYTQWLGLEEIIKVRKGEDIEGLWDARRAVAKRLPEVQSELIQHMYASGHFTDAEIDAVRRGDRGAIDNLLGNGRLKDQEMAEYFFHKGITQSEIDAFVDQTGLTPEQLSFLGKHKGTLLLVLLLALKEATVMANDMIVKPEGR